MAVQKHENNSYLAQSQVEQPKRTISRKTRAALTMGLGVPLTVLALPDAAAARPTGGSNDMVDVTAPPTGSSMPPLSSVGDLVMNDFRMSLPDGGHMFVETSNEITPGGSVARARTTRLDTAGNHNIRAVKVADEAAVRTITTEVSNISDRFGSVSSSKDVVTKGPGAQRRSTSLAQTANKSGGVMHVDTKVIEDDIFTTTTEGWQIAQMLDSRVTNVESTRRRNHAGPAYQQHEIKTELERTAAGGPNILITTTESTGNHHFDTYAKSSYRYDGELTVKSTRPDYPSSSSRSPVPTPIVADERVEIAPGRFVEFAKTSDGLEAVESTPDGRQTRLNVHAHGSLLEQEVPGKRNAPSMVVSARPADGALIAAENGGNSTLTTALPGETSATSPAVFRDETDHLR